MPVVKVVEGGGYAVLVADVALLYKTDIAAVPPSAPAAYLLTVIPRGVGKPQSPQLRFETAMARDAFYASLVTAMS